MMPQVPGGTYEPFPSVEPAERVIRAGGAQVVPDAYGVGVGDALARVGLQGENAAKELLDRGIALRQMDIDRQARDALTGLVNSQAQGRNDFLNKEGYDADGNAAQAHLQQMDQMRQQARQQLEQAGAGPYGLDKFDTDYAPYQKAITNEAIAHSVSETKKAHKVSLQTADSAGANLVRTSGDPTVYETQKNAAIEREQDKGNIDGLKPDEVDVNTKNGISSLAFNYITGVAERDTSGIGQGFDLLQKLKDNGDLSNADDIANATKAVRQRFDVASTAAIKSKTQELLDETETYGPGTPKAQRLRGEIDAMQQKRSVLGETQAVADAAGKELDVQTGAAVVRHDVRAALRTESQFQPMISRASSNWNVSPIILARLLHQESGINPNTRDSPAGAQGIAQFMPDTARQYGVDVRDPQSSIDGAAHYLSDLNRQFLGNTGLALAAYNAGPGRVEQFVVNKRPLPAETLNYVRSITGQSIQAWMSGKQPDMTKLENPSTVGGGVQKAADVIRTASSDPSFSPSQQRANEKAGNEELKEWHDTNERNFNAAQIKQSKVDSDFRVMIMQDSASEQPQWNVEKIKQLTDGDGQPSATAREAAIRWIQHDNMTGPSEAESHRNTVDAFKRINSPEGTSNKITRVEQIDDLYTSGQINYDDHQRLEKKLSDIKAPGGEAFEKLRNKFEQVVTSYFDKSTMFNVDGEGKLRAYNFMAYVDGLINQYRTEGNNPSELLLPGSKYLGSPAILDHFNVPLQQQMEEINRRLNVVAPAGGSTVPSPVTTVQAAPVNASTPAPMRRQPGESMDDFDKRTGIRP